MAQKCRSCYLLAEGSDSVQGRLIHHCLTEVKFVTFGPGRILAELKLFPVVVFLNYFSNLKIQSSIQKKHDDLGPGQNFS